MSWDLRHKSLYFEHVQKKQKKISLKKVDVTKEKVFQIAMTLISKKGFGTTTRPVISAKADFASSATYDYFDSKKSLVYEYYKQSQSDHLFWIYDETKDSTKTFVLIDKIMPLIESMNQMTQSPLATPFRKKIISTLKNFAHDLGQYS
jgi:AcrR family transcriptional regulator